MSLWRRVWNSIRPATLNRDLDDERARWERLTEGVANVLRFA